jgi:hypothetical protein
MTPATLAPTQSRNENVLAICRLLGAVALKEGLDVTALFAGSAFQGAVATNDASVSSRK